MNEKKPKNYNNPRKITNLTLQHLGQKLCEGTDYSNSVICWNKVKKSNILE